MKLESVTIDSNYESVQSSDASRDLQDNYTTLNLIYMHIWCAKIY